MKWKVEVYLSDGTLDDVMYLKFLSNAVNGVNTFRNCEKRHVVITRMAA